MIFSILFVFKTLQNSEILTLILRIFLILYFLMKFVIWWVKSDIWINDHHQRITWTKNARWLVWLHFKYKILTSPSLRSNSRTQEWESDSPSRDFWVLGKKQAKETMKIIKYVKVKIAKMKCSNVKVI